MSIEVTRIGDGMYRVVKDGRSEVVWAAADGGEQWAFWNGRVFMVRAEAGRRPRQARSGGDGHQSLTSPMPATVLKVLIAPGASVHNGDTLIVLEAMKMELPIRALADGRVRTVSCHEGELVRAGAALVDLE